MRSRAHEMSRAPHAMRTGPVDPWLLQIRSPPASTVKTALFGRAKTHFAERRYRRSGLSDVCRQKAEQRRFPEGGRSKAEYLLRCWWSRNTIASAVFRKLFGRWTTCRTGVCCFVWKGPATLHPFGPDHPVATTENNSMCIMPPWSGVSSLSNNNFVTEVMRIFSFYG